MKINTLVIMLSLLSTTALHPVFASEEPVSPVSAQPQADSCTDQGSIIPAIKNVSRNISLALLQASDDQLQLSANYIAEAEQQFDTLMAGRPVISAADHVRMVRLDYEKNKSRYFILLPLDEEIGAQGLSALSSSTPKETRVVSLHITIDGSKTTSAIEQLWHYVSVKDTQKVTAALQEILANMGNIEIAARPNYLKETYDYMQLTDNLLKEGLYGYARLSLRHVKTNLLYYAATVQDPKRNDQVKQLKLNVDILSEQLEQQQPATLKKAQIQVKEWMQSVKGWLAKEPQ